MKAVTIRLPEELIAEIEEESRRRHLSRSDVVRERLEHCGELRLRTGAPEIADIVGSVKGLPADLSENKKAYLKASYGRKRPR